MPAKTISVLLRAVPQPLVWAVRSKAAAEGKSLPQKIIELMTAYVKKEKGE